MESEIAVNERVIANALIETHSQFIPKSSRVGGRMTGHPSIVHYPTRLSTVSLWITSQKLANVRKIARVRPNGKS